MSAVESVTAQEQQALCTNSAMCLDSERCAAVLTISIGMRYLAASS